MDDYKKDVLKDVRRIQEEMDISFDHFHKLRHSPVLTARRVWRPLADVFETEKEIVILVEIAGMKQTDLNLTLSHNVLTVRGERREKGSAGRIVCQNMEINYDPFERNIRLHEPIDPDFSKAVYKDGFLKIRIPKKQGKTSEAKEIKIEVD